MSNSTALNLNAILNDLNETEAITGTLWRPKNRPEPYHVYIDDVTLDAQDYNYKDPVTGESGKTCPGFYLQLRYVLVDPISEEEDPDAPPAPADGGGQSFPGAQIRFPARGHADIPGDPKAPKGAHAGVRINLGRLKSTVNALMGRAANDPMTDIESDIAAIKKRCASEDGLTARINCRTKVRSYTDSETGEERTISEFTDYLVSVDSA